MPDQPDTKPKGAERLPRGPIDPTLRAAHRAHRADDGEAFLPDPYAGTTRPREPLTEGASEAFGEEFIEGATTGGADVSFEANDEIADDEDGGPFLVLDTDEDVPSHPTGLEPDIADPSLDAAGAPDAAVPDVARDEPGAARPFRRGRPSP